jgi:hypothetical protein
LPVLIQRFHRAHLSPAAEDKLRSAYVDLNPIRAAMVETIETSDYTSAQQRALELRDSLQKGMTDNNSASLSPCVDELTAKPIAKSLCPLTIDELRDEIGEYCHTAGDRASDKGFLPMSVADYLELWDWTARQIRADKRGATPATASRIFERLGIDAEVWCELTRDFGRLFGTVAGKPKGACGVRPCFLFPVGSHAC